MLALVPDRNRELENGDRRATRAATDYRFRYGQILLCLPMPKRWRSRSQVRLPAPNFNAVRERQQQPTSMSTAFVGYVTI
jgi:hypothetical protein